MTVFARALAPYVIAAPEKTSGGGPAAPPGLPPFGHAAAAALNGPIRELWAVVVRRWRVVAATIATVIALTVVYCLFAPRWYVARATVLIEPRARQVLDGTGPVEEERDAFTSAK